MINAETMPPTNGGMVTMAVFISNISIQAANTAAIMPAIPASEITMVFHCRISSGTESSVPMLVISRYISITATAGVIPARLTISFGKNVQ
ncbi:Uncharacterised protein [Serratia fonticola]|uniref:Uncharacterized protein n=1 Tax=Serratia fonticola TaxID=47917 RepID=A0A4U9U888_SERFO|nr:Uncharacterised protein [Serratia fonticola]